MEGVHFFVVCVTKKRYGHFGHLLCQTVERFGILTVRETRKDEEIPVKIPDARSRMEVSPEVVDPI